MLSCPVLHANSYYRTYPVSGQCRPGPPISRENLASERAPASQRSGQMRAGAGGECFAALSIAPGPMSYWQIVTPTPAALPTGCVGRRDARASDDALGHQTVIEDVLFTERGLSGIPFRASLSADGIISSAVEHAALRRPLSARSRGCSANGGARLSPGGGPDAGARPSAVTSEPVAASGSRGPPGRPALQ